MRVFLIILFLFFSVNCFAQKTQSSLSKNVDEFFDSQGLSQTQNHWDIEDARKKRITFREADKCFYWTYVKGKRFRQYDFCM